MNVSEIDYSVLILIVFLCSVVDYFCGYNVVFQSVADVRELFEEVLAVCHSRFHLVCAQTSIGQLLQNIHLVLLLVAVKIQVRLLSTVEILFD